MTDQDDRGVLLSRVEIIVLARLSQPKPQTKQAVAIALRQLAKQLDVSESTTGEAQAALEHRGLIVAVPAPSRGTSTAAKSPKKPAKPPKPRPLSHLMISDPGRLALRSALKLKTLATWKELWETAIPALALGLSPGSEAADEALRDDETITTSVLLNAPASDEPLTVNQLCDDLIMEALDMPAGPITLASIRAHLLIKHYGDAESQGRNDASLATFAGIKAAAKKPKASKHDAELKKLAASFAKERLGLEPDADDTMRRALQLYWVHGQSDGREATTPVPASTGALLEAVRQAIPVVDAAGRYGKQNVFVSALWRQITRDRRHAELSLDEFKHWLVDANRDQLVNLASADLFDAMNRELVAESTIQDLGDTFHFVVDRDAMASLSEPGFHAR